jgi:hypothetical protein
LQVAQLLFFHNLHAICWNELVNVMQGVVRDGLTLVKDHLATGTMFCEHLSGEAVFCIHTRVETEAPDVIRENYHLSQKSLSNCDCT